MATPFFARVRLACPECCQPFADDDFPGRKLPLLDASLSKFAFDCPRCGYHCGNREFLDAHAEKVSQSADLSSEAGTGVAA